jgi:hypothetical protein
MNQYYVLVALISLTSPAAFAINPSEESFCDESGDGCGDGELCDVGGNWGDGCDADGFCRCYVGECILDEDCLDSVCAPNADDSSLICQDDSSETPEVGCATGGIPAAPVAFGILAAFFRRRKTVAK